MNAILQLFRRLFGGETTIEKIVSPMQKITRNLEEYSRRQAQRADEDERLALLFQEKCDEERRAAKEAEALAENYRKSGLVTALSSE